MARAFLILIRSYAAARLSSPVGLVHHSQPLIMDALQLYLTFLKHHQRQTHRPINPHFRPKANIDPQVLGFAPAEASTSVTTAFFSKSSSPTRFLTLSSVVVFFTIGFRLDCDGGCRSCDLENFGVRGVLTASTTCRADRRRVSRMAHWRRLATKKRAAEETVRIGQRLFILVLDKGANWDERTRVGVTYFQ